MDWTHIIYVVGAIIGVEVYHEIRERLDKPYRWACPTVGCEFSAKANSREVLARVKQSHEHFTKE